jgi:hypothetical protein
MKTKLFVGIVALLAFARPAAANLLVELTFAEKMALADLVAIGTVTSVNCRREAHSNTSVGAGSTATLSVDQILKGTAGQAIEVSTFTPAPERRVRCLTAGATYLLFLTASSSGELHSVNGRYGLVRVGGQPGLITVLPPDSSH